MEEGQLTGHDSFGIFALNFELVTGNL